MGRYTDAYNEFRTKYDLSLNLQGEYDAAKRLSFDDFAMDTPSAVKAQTLYISTLSAALSSHLNTKVKLEPGKSYDLTKFDLNDFITEFDKVMDAIRTDEAAKEKTEYTHRKFEGMPIDRVATQAWAQVAPAFSKPLHEIWAGQIRKGSLSLEQLQRITNSSTSLLDDMVGPDRSYNSEANKDLADVIMIKNAMAEAINKRSWTSWLNPFNWGPNMRENAYLRNLEEKINTYRDSNFPVNSVVPEGYTTNMLGELQNTYGTRNQPTQNTAKAVKSEKNTVNTAAKTTEAKNPTVQQNIKAPAVKLSSVEEALARYNDKSVKDNFNKELEGIFPNDTNPMRAFAIQGIVGSMPSQIRGHWYPINSKATNPAKERSIKENAIHSLNSFNMVGSLYTKTMNPVDKIVALQKITNVFMRNFSPALSDSKYYQYLDNYFVQNASLEQIQEIVGKSQDIDAIMESACKELGVEKTKVYLPALSENKNDEKKTDKVDEISPLNKEKAID